MKNPMYLIVHRTGLDLPDASAEFACRVLSTVTKTRLYSLDNGLFLKVPKNPGDSELIREFFKIYPKYVPNYSLIPDENEATQFINEKLGGRAKIGYDFVTSVLDCNRVKYDLIDKESL